FGIDLARLGQSFSCKLQFGSWILTLTGQKVPDARVKKSHGIVNVSIIRKELGCFLKQLQALSIMFSWILTFGGFIIPQVLINRCQVVEAVGVVWSRFQKALILLDCKSKAIGRILAVIHLVHGDEVIGNRRFIPRVHRAVGFVDLLKLLD